MARKNLGSKIISSGELLKSTLDYFINDINELCREVLILKGEPVQPDQAVAGAMLEYMEWKDY